MANSKKMLIIYVLKTLKKYTDEDHPLYINKIIDIINSEYGMEFERKSVSRNINELIDFGYDIGYNNGYYLRERAFEDSELRLLIDSVIGSRYIPAAQAKKLIDKLNELSSIYLKKRLIHVTNLSSLQHTDNKSVFYTVDIIDEAIEKNKQVAFYYNEYGMDKKLHHRRDNKYIVNPYQMVVANGRYYLIGNYAKYDNVIHFRIDRISEIELLDSKIRPMNQIESLKNGLNLPVHMAEHIYMFSGDSIYVTFRADKNIIGDIVDWFGTDIQLMDDDNEAYCIVCVKVIERAMFYWLLQYLSATEVIKPESLRLKINETLMNGVQKYSN